MRTQVQHGKVATSGWYLSRSDVATDNGGQVAYGPATQHEIKERLWQTNETDGEVATLGVWTAMFWDTDEIESYRISVLPFKQWGPDSGYKQVNVAMPKGRD